LQPILWPGKRKIKLNTKKRIQLLRGKFAKNKIEAILVSQPENLFYLSGCEGLEGYLLITEGQTILVTDFRYIEQAQRQSPDFEIYQIKGKMTDWLPALFSNLNIKRLGFESSHLTLSVFKQIAGILKKVESKPRLRPVNGLIESLRAVKDAEEVGRIIEAIKITDSVYAYVEDILQPGMTEIELAWKIEKFMREHGSQTVPFELIVAAGANSALPHARPSGYVIQKGEPVVIDIGSKYRFYGSDLTRTFFTGKPDETFRKIYTTVLQAQQTAISNIKAGMSGSEADSIARDIISKAGHGEAFGHSLGHGIGLVTHENPRLGQNSPDILEEGMVFTLEPGIYLSGWGGIRIEDDIIIEKGRTRVLSSAPKMRF
jgi:Xaa-Pro aminopeptidase